VGREGHLSLRRHTVTVSPAVLPLQLAGDNRTRPERIERRRARHFPCMIVFITPRQPILPALVTFPA